MKKNITINYSNGFPCLGNGIDFTEECFGLQFNAALIQQTSELIWKPNSTLPNTTAQSLPAPFNVLSDLGKAMTVNLNGNTGLIGNKQLLNANSFGTQHEVCEVAPKIQTTSEHILDYS